MAESFDTFTIDAIKEISNVAAGHLAQIITGLTKKEMSITVPKAAIVKIKDASDKVGGKSVVTGYMDAYGDILGSLIFMLSKDDALSLTELTLNEKINPTWFPSQVEEDVIKELSTITAESLLTAINQFIGADIKAKKPIIGHFGAFNLLNFLKNINETCEDYENRDIVWVSIGYMIEDLNLKGEILTLLGPNILDYLNKNLDENIFQPPIADEATPLKLPAGVRIKNLENINLMKHAPVLKNEEFTGYLIVSKKDGFEPQEIGKILMIAGDIIAASCEIGSKYFSRSKALEEMFNMSLIGIEVYGYDETDIWLAIETNKSQIFEYTAPQIKVNEKPDEHQSDNIEEGSGFSVIFGEEEKPLSRGDLLSKYRIKELTEEDADVLIQRIMEG